MKKAIGVTILILIAAVIIYFFFYNGAGKNYLSRLNIISDEHPQRILSMREIDSLTAAMNYHFTIKNKVVHPVSADSIRIPLKTESPAG
jgi:hypothetical protein